MFMCLRVYVSVNFDFLSEKKAKKITRKKKKMPIIILYNCVLLCLCENMLIFEFVIFISVVSWKSFVFY